LVVTWWERNQTSKEPAAKISTDNEHTFGPILKLGTNGTLAEAEEEGRYQHLLFPTLHVSNVDLKTS
jgi:hypothetical protein